MRILPYLHFVIILITLVASCLCSNRRAEVKIREVLDVYVPHWLFATNVLNLMLFQPGRGMGFPWPQTPPYEFRRLFKSKPEDFCGNCRVLLRNWLSSEPPMLLYRAPPYVSKIPSIISVVCGAIEIKYYGYGESLCNSVSMKFNLYNYYSGLSLAPTRKRRAAFPASHTEYNSINKHHFVPTDKKVKLSLRAAYPATHTNYPADGKHGYQPVVDSTDPEDRAAFPATHTNYPADGKHGYQPVVNRTDPEDRAAFPATHTNYPADDKHGYQPVVNRTDLEDRAAFPASHTNYPAPGPGSGDIPFTVVIPVIKAAYPASHTQAPVDPNHGYTPEVIVQELVDRAAFPATHTNYPAPGPGQPLNIPWEHLSEVLVKDDKGIPYVMTAAGPVYGDGSIDELIQAADMAAISEEGKLNVTLAN